MRPQLPNRAPRPIVGILMMLGMGLGLLAALEGFVLLELAPDWPHGAMEWTTVLLLGPAALLVFWRAAEGRRRGAVAPTGGHGIDAALAMLTAVALLAWLFVAGLENVVAESAHWPGRSAPLTWAFAATRFLPAALITGGLLFALVFALIRRARPSGLVIFAVACGALAVGAGYWLWMQPGMM